MAAPSLLGLRPVRLALLGAGRIHHRCLQAASDPVGVTVMAVADADPLVRAAADQQWRVTGGSALRCFAEADTLMAQCADELDAVIIALPSPRRLAVAEQAFRRGLAVFCVDPLPWTRDEVTRLIEGGRHANRRIGLDYRFRGLSGVDIMRDAMASGSLGTITMLDVVWHQDVAPDAGGFPEGEFGDASSAARLGAQLVDLISALRPHDRVLDLLAARYADGVLQSPGSPDTGDAFTVATVRLASGTTVRLACSWGSHPGRGVDMQLRIHGTQGGLHLHNQNGSMARFELARLQGHTRQIIGVMDERWADRELRRWIDAVAHTTAFAADEAVALLQTAVVLDAITGS